MFWPLPYVGQWEQGQVLFRMDNQAVVVAHMSYSAHDPALAQLHSCLFFIKALYVLEHKVARRENAAADALFRNNVIDFFALLTQATLDPLPISLDLIKIGHQHVPDVDVRVF